MAREAREARVAVATWLRLARVARRIDRVSAARLRLFDLSVAQFDVLAQVGAREGLTQAELGDALVVTRGNVTQLVDRLETAGLLARRAEGRTNRLFLTPAGRALAHRAVPAQEDLIAALFGTLTATDLQHLRAALRRLDRSLP